MSFSPTLWCSSYSSQPGVCVHLSLHVRKIADELAGSSSYYLLKVRKSVSYSYLKVLGHQRQKISETAVVTDGGVSKSRTISTVR